MAEHLAVGIHGEDIACEYLRNNGYNVLRRNDKHPWGEIDIIAKHKKTGLLLFVEVKALTEGDGRYIPEDHYSLNKMRKTQRAAQLFAGVHPEWYDENVGWRIDLLAITLHKIPVENLKTDCTIVHYENV